MSASPPTRTISTSRPNALSQIIMRPSSARGIGAAVFLAGVAALAAVTVEAGIAPVLRALALLKFSGLGIVTLMHLPVIALLGLAWWYAGRGLMDARPGAFVAARLARDSIAEV